ncbi:hypothetical protein AOQ84DRAFT_222024 [Glonium stellatum]|uniref:Uncharacterized protein n=1 Tax=Glonium stellatum TaxID=574774 RepID=A0A8E2FD63_9PEZI|nr:hypothetical protein AOQ84DRAFT_222024 [Glonium stellatum]
MDTPESDGVQQIFGEIDDLLGNVYEHLISTIDDCERQEYKIRRLERIIRPDNGAEGNTNESHFNDERANESHLSESTETIIVHLYEEAEASNEQGNQQDMSRNVVGGSEFTLSVPTPLIPAMVDLSLMPRPLNVRKREGIAVGSSTLIPQKGEKKVFMPGLQSESLQQPSHTSSPKGKEFQAHPSAVTSLGNRLSQTALGKMPQSNRSPARSNFTVESESGPSDTTKVRSRPQGTSYPLLGRPETPLEHPTSPLVSEPKGFAISQPGSSRERPIVQPHGPHQSLRRHRRPENSPLPSPSNPNKALSFGSSPPDEPATPKRPSLTRVPGESAVHKLVSSYKLQDTPMTEAQQQEESIEYLLRNIDNTYGYIDAMPDRMSMMHDPNSALGPEEIRTVFDWPTGGSVVTEDLLPESRINKAFDKLHARKTPRVFATDARYGGCSWYEDYRSKMIQAHGEFQEVARKLQQTNLSDSYRAELTDEASKALVERVKELKAEYGIVVSEAICGTCEGVDRRLTARVNYQTEDEDEDEEPQPSPVARLSDVISPPYSDPMSYNSETPTLRRSATEKVGTSRNASMRRASTSGTLGKVKSRVKAGAFNTLGFVLGVPKDMESPGQPSNASKDGRED